MSLHHNPKIVTDGLVLAYDMDNVAKSFKGKPTENLASSNFFDGNVNFTTDETIQDTLPTGKTGDVRYLNADYVVDPNRTVSIGSYTLTAGDTYTLSFYVKNINCTGFGGNLYSPTLTTSIGSITYPAVFTDRWTRVTKTFTIPTDTVSAGGNVVMSPQVFRDGGNGFFKLSMLQLEEGTFVTPFVNGTRSNTQALLDMSKSKNTVTATSLTYNSDGTFEFDGTSDYISTNRNTITPNATYSFWVNRTQGNNNTYNMMGGIYLPYFSFRSDNRIHFSMNINGQKNLLTTSTFSNNTWYKFDFVHDYDGVDTTALIYVNGELEASATYAGAQSTPTNRTFMLGGWRSDNPTNFPFEGKIALCHVYEKALTAAEIKQNFNATRGRFGI